RIVLRCQFGLGSFSRYVGSIKEITNALQRMMHVELVESRIGKSPCFRRSVADLPSCSVICRRNAVGQLLAEYSVALHSSWYCSNGVQPALDQSSLGDGADFNALACVPLPHYLRAGAGHHTEGETIGHIRHERALLNHAAGQPIGSAEEAMCSREYKSVRDYRCPVQRIL